MGGSSETPVGDATVGDPGGPVLALLGAAVAMAFVGFMLMATDGHFVPQVVDLYVVAQYARAMAEGHPFQYNPGEGASTGATSLLHTVLLAVAHAVGMRGEGLVVFAILTGIGFYIGSILLARRIGALLAGKREGLLAGALVGLGGPVVWGFVYGSDIGLFMLLSLWLMERLLKGWNGASLKGIAASGVLLSLARPEGLPIGLLLGAALSLGPARGRRGGARILPWLPAAAGLAVVGLYRWLTGFWLGTSVADKSLVANYGLADSVALVAEYGQDVLRGLLLGFYPSQAPVGFARGWAPYYFPPLALLAILAVLVRPPESLRTPLRVWVAIVAVLFVLVSPNVFMGVHFNRYLMWAFPTLHVLVAVGLGTAARLVARGDHALERSVFHAGAGLALVCGLLSTARFAASYGEMAGEVYQRDVKTAEWIRENLPGGVAMANLATGVEYLTGHRNLNLHGVTSPAFFGNRMAEREAGVFEALGRLPEAERPPYLVTSVSAQESYPSMRQLVDAPPLFRSTSGSDELLVCRMRYDLVGKNRRLFVPEIRQAVAGLEEVDRLNVCDSRDEAVHGYRFQSRLGSLRLNGTARIDSYSLPGNPTPEVVIDSGRAVFGSESFRVRAARGRDLVIVTRTAASVAASVHRAGRSDRLGIEIAEAGMIVEAEGQVVDRFALRLGPGWNERILRIRGRSLGETQTLLRISGRYASFYYWFYQ